MHAVLQMLTVTLADSLLQLWQRQVLFAAGLYPCALCWPE